MEMTKTITGNRLEIALSGKINALTAPEFEKEAAKLLDGIAFLSIDMSGVEYISSAGIRTLLFLERSMEAVSGELVIRRVPEIIQKIFEVTGLPDLIHME